MKRGLVIGYGNSLRADDGVGWHAAMRLASDARFEDVEVIARHQLTPELAEDVASAEAVVMIDARVGGGAPGSIEIRRVSPSVPRSRMSHHMDPSGLVGLTQELYGNVPSVWVVSVRADSFDEGEKLSSAAAAALPAVAEEVARLLSGHARA